MRFLIFQLFAAVVSLSAGAQTPVRYTLWGEGVANAQLSKSALYFLGVGARVEASRACAGPAHRGFAAAGYTRFLQKRDGAYTADALRGIVGYRYAGWGVLSAHAGVGAQYLRETGQLIFRERTIRTRMASVMPTASVGVGARAGTHLRVEVEYRPALRLEESGNRLLNHIALAVGYTF